MLKICWLFNFPNITVFERESKLYKLCNVLKKELVSNERTITFNGTGNLTMAKTISNKKRIIGTKGLGK